MPVHSALAPSLSRSYAYVSTRIIVMSSSRVSYLLYFSVGDIYTPEERLEGTKSDETHVEAPHLVEIQCQRQLEHATKASDHP